MKYEKTLAIGTVVSGLMFMCAIGRVEDKDQEVQADGSIVRLRVSSSPSRQKITRTTQITAEDAPAMEVSDVGQQIFEDAQARDFLDANGALECTDAARHEYQAWLTVSFRFSPDMLQCVDREFRVVGSSLEEAVSFCEDSIRPSILEDHEVQALLQQTMLK